MLHITVYFYKECVAGKNAEKSTQHVHNLKCNFEKLQNENCNQTIN